MSCVVAVVSGDRVLMGADRLYTADSGDAAVRRDPKIFHKGELLIGFAGAVRTGQIIRRYFHPIEGPIRDIAEYIETTFLEAIAKIFKKHGIELDSEQEQADLIVAYQNRIFTIGAGLEVGEPMRPYDAVGCAYAYALGSLYSTEHLPAEERVRLALEAAECYHGFVRGPFLYEWTKPAIDSLPVHAG